jgi:CRP-like cAMP-binding protein
VLRRAALLRSLPSADLERVGALLQPRTYQRGEVVFHQGDVGETAHLVVQGHLKIVLPSHHGREAFLAIIGPGDLFGELALLDGEPRSATVVALDPVTTAVLHRADFLGLLRGSSAAREALQATLAGIIRERSERRANLMVLDQPGHLAKQLIELALAHGRPLNGHEIEITVPLTQMDLAAMIGATRTRVNRLLDAYAAQGILTRERRKMVIRDLGALQRRVTV